MPIVIEAIDLTVLLLLLVALGIALFIRLIFSPIANFLGGAPGIGGYIKSGINSALDAVVNGIYGAIHAVLVSGIRLFDGFIWLVEKIGTTVWGIILNVYTSIEYIIGTEIHKLITIALTPVRHELGVISTGLSNLETRVATDVTALKHYAATQAAEAIHTVTGLTIHAFPALHRDVVKIVDDAEAILRKDIARGVAGAAHAGDVALQDLGEILGDLSPAQLAGLLASIPAAMAIVHAIEIEAGLGNRECRSKVKGICGLDPTGWADLLGLAVTAFEISSLAEMVDAARGLLPVVAEGAQALAAA